MWRSIMKFASTTIRNERTILHIENVVNQQLRTTFILKRKYPPRLHKKGMEPKKMRNKNYIYELVKDTRTEKQAEIDVILTTYVEGLGNPGDKIRAKQNYAYTNLLLPGLAVYASPENEGKYQTQEEKHEAERYSSPKVLLTVATLSRLLLSVVMNKDVPWTIKPWHIRTSFRKSGFIVPEEAITMPKHTISGPNMDLEGKEFLIKITINKKETADVRCRIHHWSTDTSDRLPHTPEFYKEPPRALFKEDLPIIEELYETKMQAIKFLNKQKSV